MMANNATTGDHEQTPTQPTPRLLSFGVVAANQRIALQKAHDAALSVFEPLSQVQLQPKHAVRFFVNVEKTDGTAQQQKGDCMGCGRRVPSTGSYKFNSHIISCPLIPVVVQRAFKGLRDTAGSKREGKRELEALAEEEEQLTQRRHAAEQVVLKQQCIRAGLKTAEVDAADRAIAEFFYANAIPFSAASSEPTSHYRNMIAALQNAPKGYIPPSAKKMGGELLDTCHEKMWKDIAARDPGGQLNLKFGSTYVSDGWDSCDNLPLINSAFITANDGGVFWRSVDTSGKTKSAEYCGALMIADIYAFGPQKVVLVVSDTCSTMQKCWKIVEDEFPWISILPCQPHVISLLLKDVGKTEAVRKLISDEAIVNQWFSNHHFPLAKLRDIVLRKLGKAKELIKAGATRFGTNTLVGERLLELKGCLQATVVDEEYAAHNYKDSGNTEEETATGRVVRSNKGATAKKLVLDDGGFWSRVNTHVRSTLPIFKMLRRFDTGSPTLGKLYSSWFELGEHLKTTEDSEFKQVAVDKHADRWAYGHAAIAAAAYVLDPEFHNHSQGTNTEVMEGFFETVEKVGILNEIRRLAHESDDFEVAWKKRAELIKGDSSKQSTWAHYPKYPSADNGNVKVFCQKVSAQLAIYRGRKGIFARDWIMEGAAEMPAYMWWEMHGSSVPELQIVACIVLAQPSSASICERINGEFAFVKDIRRNRLGHVKTNKLVGLFHNLRLRNRMKAPMYSEPVIGWNDDENKSGIIKYGVTHYVPAKKGIMIPTPARPQVYFEDGEAPDDEQLLFQ